MLGNLIFSIADVNATAAMQTSQARKRPRPIVSCLRCREKKLKCDRAMPCQNCVKSGCRADCTYNQQPGAESQSQPKRVQLSEGEHDQHTIPVTAGVGIIEDLQMRVIKLEELLAGPNANWGPIRDAPVQSSWPQADTTQSTSHFLGTLVVKGSRSRYHGQNNRTTLLNQFADAKTFIDQCSSDSALVGLAKEVQFLQSKSQLVMASPESLSGLDKFPEMQRLLNSLPPKPVCDQLLEVYTKNFEKTLRVLHIPSLLRQYNDFWDNKETHSSSSSMFFFVPLLTSILTVAVSFETPPPSPEYSSSWEYLMQDAPGLISDWLKHLPRRQTVELCSLQVQTIHLFSCQLRLVPVEEQWKASGALVRSAMTMGLHVNLSQATSLSFFQAEIRRRLWVTIVEMDLQASIASGMPVMTPDLDFDPLTPNNLNDEDFGESTLNLPLCKTLDEETDSSAQIILATCMSQRIRAMNMAQNSNARGNIEERAKQGRELEECLLSVSPHLRLEPELGSHDPSLVLQRVLLDVYLRRPLLCLYRPVITNAPNNRDDTSFYEVQRVCLDSSLEILSYQDYFDPSISDLDVSHLNTYWNAFGTLFQNDILLSALSICDHMRLSNQRSTIPSPSNDVSSETPSHHETHTKASLIRVVENTLATLTRRIGEKTSNMKDILLLAVVLSSVRARGTAEQKVRTISQGARKALSACRQHLLSSAAEQSIGLQLADFAQLIQSNESIIPSDSQPQLSPISQMPDLSQPSLLATEFNSFETDLFSFDDESFTWNM